MLRKSIVAALFSLLSLLLSASITINAHAEPLNISTSSQAKWRCENIEKDIEALINHAPLALADIRVGTDGKADVKLARALDVRNNSRHKSASGLELPSDMEKALRKLVTKDSCFSQFASLIKSAADDTSGSNRAVLQINMPIATLKEVEVEYAKNTFRKNFLYQISLNLELRDDRGRVVYSQNYTDSLRKTCFFKGHRKIIHACTGATDEIDVDVLAEWKGLLERSVHGLLARVNQDVPVWHNMLTAQKDRFFDKKYSQKIETNASKMRHRDSLDLPYFYVQTPKPNVNISNIIKNFNKDRFITNMQEEKQFQDFFNERFRSVLAESLRREFGNNGKTEDARILVLSDDQAEAFKNAMMITCAAQSGAYENEDCLQPQKLIDRLCSKKSKNNKDYCHFASLAYGEIEKRNHTKLKHAYRSTQLAEAASFLRKPSAPDSKRPVVCRVSGGGRTFGLTASSKPYINIATAKQKDDGFYLMDAANKVLQKQADCLAQQIVSQYRSLLKPCMQ